MELAAMELAAMELAATKLVGMESWWRGGEGGALPRAWTTISSFSILPQKPSDGALKPLSRVFILFCNEVQPPLAGASPIGERGANIYYFISLEASPKRDPLHWWRGGAA